MKSKSGSRRKAPKAGTLGRRIYDQRRALFMKQEDLAKACHVTRAAVSQWENNVTVPKLALRPLIAGALSVYPHQFFDDIEEAESA